MWVEYALPGGCVQRRFGERAVRFASAEFTDAVAVRVDLPTGTRDERRVPETCGVSTYTRFGNMHVSYFFFFGNRGRKGRTGDVEDCGVIDKRKKRHTTALFASEKSSIVVFCCTCELKRNTIIIHLTRAATTSFPRRRVRWSHARARETRLFTIENFVEGSARREAFRTCPPFLTCTLSLKSRQTSANRRLLRSETSVSLFGCVVVQVARRR